MKQTKLRIVLLVITQVLRHALKKHELVRRHAGNRRCTVQIKLKDDSIGRYYAFDAGKVHSTAGIHPNPDLNMVFKDLDTALTFLSPGVSQAEIIHAAKNFRVMVLGPDELGVWFMQLMNLTQTASLSMGTPMRDGTTRFTTNTNGGPLFVYVKDDKIVRMTPIDLDETDAQSWTITARGKQFTPKRRAMINPHAQCLKSLVYSEKRILHPMKRVDFDPNGERNPQNRGKSGYVRISWDEALDLVGGEIKRLKRQYGPGVMAVSHGSHHTWGNIGYYLSALFRFG